MITTLRPNEIFVFGSNLAGRHGAGAARQAMDDFSAVYGIGEGLTGDCYAFPTLDGKLRRRTISELQASRDKFYKVANANPLKIFLLTKVGCGLAGYPESEMIELFRLASSNVMKPEGW